MAEHEQRDISVAPTIPGGAENCPILTAAIAPASLGGGIPTWATSQRGAGTKSRAGDAWPTSKRSVVVAGLGPHPTDSGAEPAPAWRMVGEVRATHRCQSVTVRGSSASSIAAHRVRSVTSRSGMARLSVVFVTSQLSSPGFSQPAVATSSFVKFTMKFASSASTELTFENGM